MKLTIALAATLAATVFAAPYSRCQLGGKVIDCNKMGEELEKMLGKYNDAPQDKVEIPGNNQWQFEMKN